MQIFMLLPGEDYHSNFSRWKFDFRCRKFLKKLFAELKTAILILSARKSNQSICCFVQNHFD